MSSVVVMYIYYKRAADVMWTLSPKKVKKEIPLATQHLHWPAMALTLSPLASSSSLDSSFGRVAWLSSDLSHTSGEDLISDGLFGEIEKALYTHGVIIFPKVRSKRLCTQYLSDVRLIESLPLFSPLSSIDSSHTCGPICAHTTL